MDDKTRELAAATVIADLADTGGGTYEYGTLLPFRPTSGYAVGIGGLRYPADVFTTDVVPWLLKAAASEYGTSYVGTWLNEGTVFIDAVRYFVSRSEAIVAGIEAGQEAIYDFAAKRSIILDTVGE